LKVCDSCIRWRRKAIHIAIRSVLFTVLRVSLVSCILSQLNILCTSLVTPHYNKNNDSPVFTTHTLRPFYVFSNILEFIEVNWYIYKTFSSLSGVRTALDILCISAVKQHYARKHNSLFKFHPFPCALKFTKARKTCRVVRDVDHLKCIRLHWQTAEHFDILNVFLRHHITGVIILKIGQVFWPTLYVFRLVRIFFYQTCRFSVKFGQWLNGAKRLPCHVLLWNKCTVKHYFSPHLDFTIF